MPYVKLYIHLVWATKNREPMITSELKPLLLEHIRKNAKKKDIFLDCVNCVQDHIHLLISLGTEQTIAKTVMLLKGESSFWVNKQKLTKTKFEWQDEYGAFAVSYSGIDKVREYIARQEEHHAKKTFTEEYKEFIEENGLSEVLAKAKGV
jgi:putative transposase